MFLEGEGAGGDGREVVERKAEYMLERPLGTQSPPSPVSFFLLMLNVSSAYWIYRFHLGVEASLPPQIRTLVLVLST